MQHKSLAGLPCPIARGLEHVGEWWSILIMRDALRGLTRFDEFQQSLPIAPNTLTKRLNALVEAGLLQRRQYSARPPRHEYIPTTAGEDFQPVIVALFDWGKKHYGPKTPKNVYVHLESGLEAQPVLMDTRSGHPISAQHFRLMKNPANRSARRAARGTTNGTEKGTAA